MDQRFLPKKDWKIGTILFIPVLLVWAIASFRPEPFPISGAVLVSALVASVWFGTSYRINSDFVLYQTGPFRGKIPIGKIIEIKRNSRSWAGTRPVLSTDCLRIRYNKYDMIWFAPKEKTKFIQAICELNPTIAVRD